MKEVEEFLSHYGKKGMKWGVRRKSGSGSKGSPSGGKPKAKDLTDDQLKTAIGRMELEKRYNELSGAHKTPNKAVVKFISNVGSTVAKTAVTAVATQKVSAALTKATTKKA